MAEDFAYPLTAEQLYFYDYQKTAPDTTMYNPYPVLFKLRDFVDPEKFAQTLVKNLQAHPAFLSVIEEHNGIPVQKYDPAKVPFIPVEKISEADLFSIKDDLIQPFGLDGGPLSRLRVFITEQSSYVFSDNHHIICDGIGAAIFIHDIQKFYDGQEVPPDPWFAYLQEREAAKSSPHYAESKKWHEDFYGHVDFCGYPHTDFPDGGQNKQGLLQIPAGVTDNGLDILRRFHLTHTEFFNAVSLIATAEYNHDPRVLITWCYRGRWKKEHHRIVGMMIQDIPVYVNMQGLSAGEILAAVREQTKSCLAHRDYPYASLDEKMLEDDNLCVLYHGNLHNTYFIDLFEKSIEIQNKKTGSENILNIEIEDNANGIDLLFDYAAHRYNPESIQRFADMFVRIIHDLLSAMNKGSL